MEENREDRFKIVGKRLPEAMREAIRELGKEMPIDFVEVEDKEPGEPELIIETKCGSTKVSGAADKARLMGELTGVSCETIERKQRELVEKEVAKEEPKVIPPATQIS